MPFSYGKLVHEHPLATGLQLWLPGLRPFAGGGRWHNIARPWNDGTANGTVNWAGNYRNGMAFRGNGSNAYYSIETTGLTDLPSSGMAVAVSVKWTDTTVGQCAVGFGRSSTTTPLFILGNGATSGAKARFQWRNDASSGQSHETTASFNDGLWHRLFFWRSTSSGGSYRFSVDGQSLSTTTLSANPITIDRIAVGALVRTSVGSYWTGDISDVMLWRTLTVNNKPLDELQMMRWDYEEWSKGWPELLNRRRRPLIFLPSSTSYSITADYGAFSLNGQAASLLANRHVKADYGAFSLNGQAASLMASRRVAADNGAFSLNGQAASLLANRRVTADYGSFALNGQDANFLRGRTLTADYGSFALNGQVASLLATRRVTADYGAFSLNGQDANFMRGRTLVATYGSFALAGQDAGLLATRRVAADYGNFALNGQTAGLFLGRRVTADYGAFSLTGQAASLLTARRVAADYGSFALNGQAATLTWSGYEETIVQIVIHGMSLARDVTIAGMNLSRDVTIDGTDLSRDITIAIDPWN